MIPIAIAHGIFWKANFFYPLVNKHSDWKWPFIVSFPIKNGDFPYLYYMFSILSPILKKRNQFHWIHISKEFSLAGFNWIYFFFLLLFWGVPMMWAWAVDHDPWWSYLPVFCGLSHRILVKQCHVYHPPVITINRYLHPRKSTKKCSFERFLLFERFFSTWA